ncbi:MAG: rhamnan synthesis protein F [Oscillospiraceae bacterium]|nr:rhamnan synthesis protein F [Oscillospiraceae bacterium]
MRLSNEPKRACIYFLYDKDGIVDDYVICQLLDIKKNVSFLHCVVNGELSDDGRKKVSEIVDELYERENKGNDIGAYKAALEYIGWEKLSKYDELVILNNTCFGPVYPFSEVFDWAAEKDIDFWGLTMDTKSNWLGTTDYLHYNKSEHHLQSYFIVFRRPLLGSDFLTEFFREIPDDTSYITSGCFFEYAFPGYFEERGYKWDVYCKTNDYDYPLLFAPASLLRDFRMPLFKKRSFFHHYTDVLNHSGGEATAELIGYLENETDYDMKMVWKSVLRTGSLSDIVRCSQLERVLSSRAIVKEYKPDYKVGVVYHAYYPDLFDESLDYLSNFPKGTKMLITTNTDEKKCLLSEKLAEKKVNAEIKVIENRGRDVSSLLVGAADFINDFDLICFAHDKKSTQIKPGGVGRSWQYKLNQNMFATDVYVQNVIGVFEEEPCLGIAFPSPPNHSFYPYNLGNGWLSNYHNTKKLLDKFGVNVKTNEHTLCVAPMGTCFWFRPEALKKLFGGYSGNGWSFSDFPREPNRYDQTLLHAIERAYAYFAQDAGYYPVYLYNSEYAPIEFTNLEFSKTGSTDMRMWVDRLAMTAISYSKNEEQGARMNDDSVVTAPYNQITNYGVKQSLLHLAYALRCKYPRFWAFMLPIRRLGQKILRIKTK